MTHVLKRNRRLHLVRLEIKVDMFDLYLRRAVEYKPLHLQNAERLSSVVIANNFDITKSIDFVRAVCLWGEDPRIAGKVIKRNRPRSKISHALSNAYHSSIQGEIARSLQAITSLEGLAISFGTKHLKFLDPDRHVVLDSIISESLGYKRDRDGYLNWLEACHEFLQIVNDAGVPYTGTGANGWRVADIEMAIFNRIRRGEIHVRP
jgi:hypothetical protein